MSIFQGGHTKLDRVLARNQDAQRKNLYFVNWECRRSNIKKCAPKLSFLNEKINIRKIQMVLEIENWLWKSFFRQFWAVWCCVYSQNTLAECHFLISFLLRIDLWLLPLIKSRPLCRIGHFLLEFSKKSAMKSTMELACSEFALSIV